MIAEPRNLPVARHSSCGEAEVDHVIVGTGFSGLAMANELIRRGFTSIRIIERGQGPGGVWRTNIYPGSACDVPSHLYSLEALPDYDWSRIYPPQREILDYLDTNFRRLGLDRLCKFDTELVAAQWCQTDRRWLLTLSGGQRLRCQFLYAATGQLPVETIPDLPGMDRFEGAIFHSSRWQPGLDLVGKRVAVVGTGASAVQIIPELAATVGHLHVVQRNAPWILPRGDRAYKPWERRILKGLPWLRDLYRRYLYARHEINGLAFFTQARFFGIVERTTQRLIRRAIADQGLRAKTVPKYHPGCKRILVSDDYYPALARDNVTLIAAPMTELTSRGFGCADGSKAEVDAVVFATGFAGTCPMPGIAVSGRNGLDLHAHWAAGGVRAFCGTQVGGFPNLFLLIGPNVGLAHNSVIYMMESQVELIGRLVSHALVKDRPSEVAPAEEVSFNARVDDQMARRVWQTGGCTSWYHDNEGRNVGLWPEYTFLYRRRLRATGWSSQTESVHA